MQRGFFRLHDWGSSAQKCCKFRRFDTSSSRPVEVMLVRCRRPKCKTQILQYCNTDIAILKYGRSCALAVLVGELNGRTVRHIYLVPFISSGWIFGFLVLFTVGKTCTGDGGRSLITPKAKAYLQSSQLLFTKVRLMEYRREQCDTVVGGMFGNPTRKTSCTAPPCRP